MTKQDYLKSLPIHRKASLYRNYLEYNRYWDDLIGLENMRIDDWFDKDDFNSYEISRMIDCHSSCLSDKEWEIYKELDDEYSY